MLDGLTVDQLRTFVAAADAGSFSAAGRSLGRAQAVVSQTLANLEAQIEIKVFDRTGRLPVLTDTGLALLGEARVVIGVWINSKRSPKTWPAAWSRNSVSQSMSCFQSRFSHARSPISKQSFLTRPCGSKCRRTSATG
jgi:DNA-binding transcriptional LysR family regulator